MVRSLAKVHRWLVCTLIVVTTFIGTSQATEDSTTKSQTTKDPRALGEFYCQGDYCDTPKGVIAIKDLPKNFPYAEDRSNCLHEFCYNEDWDIIGLNPEWTFD